MSSFPPQRWDVRFTKDMRTLSCSYGSEGPSINMEAFLAVKPASGEEGGFRFVLDGPDKITLRFNIQSILPSGLFSGMVAETEVLVGEHIQMKLNSTCSEWMDVADLVRSQDLQIYDGLGEDAGDEFLAALESYKKDLTQETGKSDRAGICFRWCLGTLEGDKKVLLLAQVKYDDSLEFSATVA